MTKDYLIEDRLQTLLLKSNKKETDYKEIEQLLSDPSLDINYRMNNGYTYLTYAIEVNDNYLVDLLLKQDKLDLNKRTALGWPALHLAIKNDNLIVFNALKKGGGLI